MTSTVIKRIGDFSWYGNLGRTGSLAEVDSTPVKNRRPPFFSARIARGMDALHFSADLSDLALSGSRYTQEDRLVYREASWHRWRDQWSSWPRH
jgi:hypothetical protein